MNKAISAHAETTEGSLKQAAISLVEAGFRVFRLRPNEKVPLARGWQTEATENAEAVARLWDTSPHANIGVATGGGIVGNNRTTITSLAVRFLTWDMLYHAEHHACMALPFHALPKAHALFQDRIHTLTRGYLAFNRQLVRNIRERAD